jgi:hypothetical protein
MTSKTKPETTTETTTATDAEKKAAKATRERERRATRKAETDTAAAAATPEPGRRYRIEYLGARGETGWVLFGTRATAETAIAAASRTWRVRDAETEEILHERAATPTP